MQFRQGDVLLRRIDDLPDDAVAATATDERLVLAEGEKTGHAHAVIDGDVALYETAGARFLDVRTPARLAHEEHATIEIPQGVYEVVLQRTYAPGPGRVARFVAD